jgi:hypothetical protein
MHFGAEGPPDLYGTHAKPASWQSAVPVPRQRAVVLAALKTKGSAALNRAGLDRRCARRSRDRAGPEQENVLECDLPCGLPAPGTHGDHLFRSMTARGARVRGGTVGCICRSCRYRRHAGAQDLHHPEDLCNIIGMTRESTNKQLRIWEDKKWVRLERNAVVVLATNHLTAVAEDGAHGA